MKLKPCPFCGGEARLMYKHTEQAYYIVCKGCRTHTWDCNEADEATSIWNRRVEDNAKAER